MRNIEIEKAIYYERDKTKKNPHPTPQRNVEKLEAHQSALDEYMRSFSFNEVGG